MQPQPRRAYFMAVAEAVRAALHRSSSYYGYELVDLTCLGDTLLIAFRWHETAQRIFVFLVDLRLYDYPVDVAETLISTNFFERLSNGWYEQIPIISTSNFTCFSLPEEV